MPVSSFDPKLSRTIALHLLEIGAVKINVDEPFVWTSGKKSPIYCDNRLTLGYPEIRNKIRDSFAEIVKKHFSEVDTVAGVATAGIPHGALVADQLEVPYVYVRAKPKAHGLQNMIEGRVEAGTHAVVVEDLVSTGRSALQAVEALREAGANVLGMIAIFTYGFPEAEKAIDHHHIDLITLSNYSDLIEVASEKGFIDPSKLDLLRLWREEPEGWGG